MKRFFEPLYDTPPKGVHDLWGRVAKEWNEIPPETCQTLIESMPQRIQVVLKAKRSYKVLDHKLIEAQKTVLDPIPTPISNL